MSLVNSLILQLDCDFNAITIISVELTDTENYKWERCNSIVLSWLLNSVSEDPFFGQIFSDNAFEPIRSSLLSRETLLDVKDAFAIVSREESHRGLDSSSSGFVTKPQVSSFVAKSNNWSNNGNKKAHNNKRFGNSRNNRGPNPNLHCKWF
uniref:Ribonuclease H-like domain-containing protein n=1 Tax=Tanacetum cinerariifolium TaxID=118510 RepID=A0A699J0W2_TANCI|nr:ribonuclease H-like domain-containing protein [Tanacetum cinerariifolium]